MMARKIMSRLRSELGAGVLAVCLGVTVIAAQAAEVTYALRIENGHVAANMRLIRVSQGDVVKLQWSADRPTTIHLHGYDIEKQIAPGAITELTFTARATGRFAVHVHGNAAEAHGHEESLVTIEVYPR
jgi:FtsP/CotA-like multicopper oxidase with cupredoxin domain